MNLKLQFVTSGAFEWCIQGLLPKQQEDTLFKLCAVYKKIISPQLDVDSLPDLEEEVHLVLAMTERDFPATLQNLVSHLIHHVVDGFRQFRPLYGRWLFPYERANGWITRQCLKKGGEESTVMETYAIYDMCVYMVLANKFTPETHQMDNSLLKASERISDFLTKKIDVNVQNDENIKFETIPNEAKVYMEQYYSEVGLEDQVFKCEVNPLQDVNVLDVSGSRYTKYSCASKSLDQKEKKDSSFVLLQNGKVGQIESIFEHQFGQSCHIWMIIDIFPSPERFDHFSCVDNKFIGKHLVHHKQITKPLVVSKVGELVWILNI